MNFSFSGLMAGFVFGTLGFYLLRHGKKQAHTPFIVIGLALMIYPYFIENEFLLWGVGGALLFSAYRLKG